MLGEGAEAEVWERYTSEGEGLFNGVVELVVGDGANLRYVCEQELSDEGWVFATQRAEVGRDANLEWVALGFGSARGKVRMETKLAGRGSSAKVTGAYAGDGSQHLDYDTTQEHAAEDTTSDLAFRGVLAERATAVWRGMIRVDQGAQRTDAFQESRNLLLSTDAHADAIPGLEIEADDVRCTHAAAVAQVDPEQLYYLRSHGLADAEAKRLVIEGFLQELVERAHEGPIREVLRDQLERRLGAPARPGRLTTGHGGRRLRSRTSPRRDPRAHPPGRFSSGWRRSSSRRARRQPAISWPPGRAEAHKLNGLLGTLGLARGSELAAAIESELESAAEGRAGDGWADRVRRTVAELRAEIESG